MVKGSKENRSFFSNKSRAQENRTLEPRMIKLMNTYIYNTEISILHLYLFIALYIQKHTIENTMKPDLINQSIHVRALGADKAILMLLNKTTMSPHQSRRQRHGEEKKKKIPSDAHSRGGDP